jgi:aldehyde:ferredoxin oxidoreductase
MMKALALRIDLSSKVYTIEEIPHEVIMMYVGGRGLGAYLLYRSLPAKIDPFGEENHLIFTAGPASGTTFPFSSKANLNTKSPLTGGYLYSIASGILAEQMRKAGLWAIDIYGIADTPTYLDIRNEEVRFKDASSLWGMETAGVQSVMLGGVSPKVASTVAIGQAGEGLVKSAAVFTEGSHYRCFGRGGAGAVMGAKKLKGMVVMGDGPIEIADAKGLRRLKEGIAKNLKTDWRKWADEWRRYETAADLRITNQMGIIPTRNWMYGQFEGWAGIDKSTTPMGWPEKNRACGPYCLTPGCHEVEVKEGPYKGAHSDFEWETIYAFGSNCGVDKMEAIVAASQICDEFGIDTMTAGVTIGFAMECFERGLIGPQDTDGLELRFGNDEAMIGALNKMIRQEGFGKKLLKGTKRLSQEIKGSEAFAMHAKGLELGGYECRGLNGQALQFAISTRGGCHHAYGLPARSEVLDGTRLNVKGKGEYVKNAAVSRIIRDSTIVCTFLSVGPPEKQVISNATLAQVLSALLGESWSTNEIQKVGERIMCIERLFNAREGMTRADDTLPTRLLQEPSPAGPAKGAVVPLEELKDDFYEAMGYDSFTGIPPDTLLATLGIRR